jgi:hypothetical protein
MLDNNQNLPVKNTWGGVRANSGRPALKMDPQTRRYYDAYNIQRLHAGYRDIEWQFTFDEWLAWWGDDIVNRGQGNGKLVMARHNDKGPYHPDNVRKATHNQNSQERYKGKAISAEGMLFDSITLASKHFGLTSEAVRYRMKTRPTEYYFVK